MLADRKRCLAFERAIAVTVGSGDHVLEIGAGSGLLSHFALRSGAGRVTAVEASTMAELLPEVLEDERVVVQACLARDLRLPPETRADVLILELLGHVGVDEGILGVAKDARSRLMKDTGAIVPNRIRVIATPVEAPTFQRDVVQFWQSNPYGLNGHAIAEQARRRSYIYRAEPIRDLATAQTVWDFKLGEDDSLHDVSLVFPLTRSGRIDGISATFVADLAEGVEIVGQATTNWYPVFIPLNQPVFAECGNQIKLDWVGGTDFSWRPTLSII